MAASPPHVCTLLDLLVVLVRRAVDIASTFFSLSHRTGQSYSISGLRGTRSSQIKQEWHGPAFVAARWLDLLWMYFPNPVDPFASQ
ncbi:hypothetical protein C8R44DRAFT_798601 [Mycena epipterygia]|nr:hypothetical protein C8R44DRAFT_798601 [Mycena epipterygia]